MALYGETQCKGHYKDVAQYCKYCDEIYVSNFLLEKILRCICIETLFASVTPYIVGEIIIWSAAELILYLAIKMKLTEKKIRENLQIQQGVEW